MTDYKKNLNRIGWVLVIFGLLDMVVMIYCIFIMKVSYSSSFNIFAVIAGIFLIRNNLKAVNIVTKLSIFYLGGFLGLIIMSPWLISRNLVSINDFKGFPGNIFIFIYGLFTLVLVWIYCSLRDNSVVEAMQKANVKLGFWGKTPFYFFYLGLAVPIVAALIEIFEK